MNNIVKRMVNTLQKYCGVGTKQIKGRKWYVCPCCHAPGKTSKSRKEWYKAAKKFDKLQWKKEINKL